MNDKTTTPAVKRPELIELLEKFNGLSANRNELISQIEESVDRIRNNRTPSEAPKCAEPSECISGMLEYQLNNMDYSNERLAIILKRLKELV